MDSALRTQLLPIFGTRTLDRNGGAIVHGWFGSYRRVAPGGGNRTLGGQGQIVNTAVTYGHLDINPTRSVLRNRRPKPTRLLSRVEIDRRNAALDADRGEGPARRQAAIVRLLLLTGCRKGEAVDLRWSEVDGNTVRLVNTKPAYARLC